nr:hypothetical protein [Tanacetum cinerariifolium]
MGRLGQGSSFQEKWWLRSLEFFCAQSSSPPEMGMAIRVSRRFPLVSGEPKRKKAKKDVFTVNLYYDGLFTSCSLIYFQGQCRVLTDTNFDEMTYVHLLEILKRNEELRKTRIKESESSDDDHHYSDDDVEEIKNVDFHTEGDDNVVIKNITTQDPFLTKLCSARNLFRGNVEYGVNDETPQVDPDYIKIDLVYKRQVLVYCGRNIIEGRCAGKKGNKHRVLPNKVRTSLFRGDEGNQASKKPVNKKPDSQSGEGTSQSPKWIKKQILNSKKVNCPFRLYASGMFKEHSFQIKSLRPKHKCCRNYNLGSLITYKWIVMHYFKEIIEDPFMPLRKIRDDIRPKFMIDVSVRQCKRAKQLALFDHDGELIKHYAKLYHYRQALLDSNHGSTCALVVVESDNRSVSFKRMCICFKGVKDGWLAGCRKVIGLDGCFLKHTCRGELLTAMGRDANNQIYLIAWAVGLIDAINDWLPEAKHYKCTRHIYANFKKKYSGLQYQRLFWAAASCTLEQQFLQIMDQIKLLDANAYDYLIQRNLNSWSRAFFEIDKCATFENGISKSFNRAILGPRMKPIITMLEEIRLYIMQRLVAINKLAFSLEDTLHQV